MSLLRHLINSERREYFIEKVNEPLIKAITILGNRYPEPTREGENKVVHPNSLRLLDIFDEYLFFEDNPRLKALGQAMKRIVISKAEHSPNYRDRISFFVEKLIASGWKPRAYGHPVNDWKEPVPYGGVR